MDQLDRTAAPPDHSISEVPRGLPIRTGAEDSQPELGQRKSIGYALLATAREPMAILDSRLRLVAASRSYYRMFPVKFSASFGRPFCEPSDLPWRGPALRALEDVVSGSATMEDLEVEIDTPHAGPRLMLLNARRTSDPAWPDAAVLLGLEDVTEKRENERLKGDLLKQRDALLQEAHHRIANSLQIIASILLLRARSVQSEETRRHLHDVHKRLILIATVQRQLSTAGMHDTLEFGPYVAQLCAGLAASMTDDNDRVNIVTSSTSGVIDSGDAVSFGLIVTELVINALKHGFPDGRSGCIHVDFTAAAGGWRLTVLDDGVGRPPSNGKRAHTGLGTYIVEALAHHLKARVETSVGGPGSSTAIVKEADKPQL